MERIAVVERKTNETDIKVSLNLDGSGKNSIQTGIGFFDHMLEGFSKHGFFDLEISVNGDLKVDGHHTVEDTGIVLGETIKKAVADKKGIKRFGQFLLPMDDSLALCAIDLSARPYFAFDCSFGGERVGEFELGLVKEFFYALSYSSGMNLHLKMLSGDNDHHKVEAMFKAFAKALDEATSYDPRITGVLSTKGSLL